jgi:hypothetical protein
MIMQGASLVEIKRENISTVKQDVSAFYALYAGGFKWQGNWNYTKS